MSHFVVNETKKLRKVLLCKPDHFYLQPINEIASEFIRQGIHPDPQRCLREHAEFAEAIAASGTEVIWVEPQPTLPYQVFTRDIGVATRQGVLLGSFFQPVRIGEEQVAEKVLEAHTPIWRRVTSPGIVDRSDRTDPASSPKVAFEGGDFMYMDDGTVALGMGARTTQAGVEQVKAIMAEVGVEVIPVRFDPQYLHIDMVFNVVAERVAVVCREALPEDFVRLVHQRGFDLIDEPRAGVFKLNCNLLALDEGLVLSSASNVQVNQRLKALGIRVVEVDLRDLLMGGGGPHCMSFPVMRD
jgi:N-dimethylarginine dimethylaminohydrolase